MGGIIIGGDLALANHTIDISSLDSTLFNDKNNILLFNLEGPLVESETNLVPLNPYKYNLFTETLSLTALKKNKLVVSLANNHINDFKEGLKNTIKNLEKHKIDYFGLSNNRYLELEIENNKCLVFGYNSKLTLPSSSKNISSISKTNFNDIRKARKNSPNSIIIVFGHFGFELSKYPMPADRNWSKKMIDYGADFVIGSHPHVIQPYEKYKNSYIFYSLGNFILPQKKFLDRILKYSTTKVNSGLLIKIISKSNFKLYKIKTNNQQSKITYEGELFLQDMKSIDDNYDYSVLRKIDLPKYYPTFENYGKLSFHLKYLYVRLTQFIRRTLIVCKLYNPY